MKGKTMTRRRFSTTTAAATLTSGCIRRSDSYRIQPDESEPPSVGGWGRTDELIHPWKDARAAVARQRGNRVAVATDPSVPARLREVMAPHRRVGIRAVHPFGRRVGVVTWRDAEMPHAAPFPVFLLSTDLQKAKQVAETTARPIVTTRRLVFIPQPNGRVDMHRALDGARVAEVRGSRLGGMVTDYPVVSMVAMPPFAVLALETEDRPHSGNAIHNLFIQLTRTHRVHGPRESRVARNRPLRTWWGMSKGAALASRGPTVVCASISGFTWFDWGLEPRHAQFYDRSDRELKARAVYDVSLGPANAAHGLFENKVLISCRSPGAKPVALKPDMPFRDDDQGDAWKPLPGPAGLVALAPPGKILCFNAHGQLHWEFKRNGSAPALVVDGGILVEHDAALFKLSWDGKFEHIWTAPEPLTARPLHHDGYWYVASTMGLHKLAPG